MPKHSFGDFELDLDALQLRLHGEPVRLERRALDLLVLLVRHQGRLVVREEIIAALWPAKVVIDFDAGLNTLVRKDRSALGDSPDEPRYIETVAGRGYRFIAPVAAVTDSESAPEIRAEPQTKSRTHLRSVAVLLFLLLAVGITAWVWQAGHIVNVQREAPEIVQDGREAPRVDLSAQTLAVLPLRASASDEASMLLAQSVTELIRDRRAALALANIVLDNQSAALQAGKQDFSGSFDGMAISGSLTCDHGDSWCQWSDGHGALSEWLQRYAPGNVMRPAWLAQLVHGDGGTALKLLTTVGIVELRQVLDEVAARIH